MRVQIKSVTVRPDRCRQPLVRHHYRGVIENGVHGLALFTVTQSEIDIERRSYRLRYERQHVDG